MLDSIKCWFDKCDDHPEYGTQILGFSIGILNHSAIAACVLAWLKSPSKLRCDKFGVHIPQSTWRSASKIAVTQVHVWTYHLSKFQVSSFGGFRVFVTIMWFA